MLVADTTDQHEWPSKNLMQTYQMTQQYKFRHPEYTNFHLDTTRTLLEDAYWDMLHWTRHLGMKLQDHQMRIIKPRDQPEEDDINLKT